MLGVLARTESCFIGSPRFPGIIIGALKREISNSFCRPLLLSGVIAATEHLARLRGEVRGQRRFQRMEVGQGRRRDGRQGPRYVMQPDQNLPLSEDRSHDDSRAKGRGADTFET